MVPRLSVTVFSRLLCLLVVHPAGMLIRFEQDASMGEFPGGCLIHLEERTKLRLFLGFQAHEVLYASAQNHARSP